MKAIIKTKELQDALSKVIKGASCNKMLPLTSLVELSVKEDVVELTTTDGTNFLRYVLVQPNEEQFDVVVDVTLLSNLVSKLTTLEVELTKTSVLTIKGNGTYKIELPVDEEGKEIKFPNPFLTFSPTHQSQLSEECCTRFIKSNKSALATSLAEPCYTGYYIGNRILTTDSYKICCNDYKLVDRPILVSGDTMKLVELFNGLVMLNLNDTDEIVFGGQNMSIYSRLMQGIENFNATAIINLVDAEFENKAEITRKSLLDVLDRISLFVSPFDKNNVNLHFTKEGLVVNSLQSTGEELIKYVFINPVKDFTCSIDVVTLKQQLASQSGDNVEIWYGKDNAIKLVDGDTTQIVALSVE